MSKIEHFERLACLSKKIEATETASSEMMSVLKNETCRRLQLPSQKDNFSRLEDLILVGAFEQAAMALIQFELPQWKLRRLAYDEGTWHCALSRQRELPDWLDQSVESHHADLSLAIICTYLQVLQQREEKAEKANAKTPKIRSSHFEPMLCENFR